MNVFSRAISLRRSALFFGLLNKSVLYSRAAPPLVVATRTHCYLDMKPKVYVTRNDYARIGLDLLKEE